MKVKVRDEITNLLASGIAYSTIASEMKVTEGAVRNWHKSEKGIHPMLADVLKAFAKKENNSKGGVK